jgi:hypothetical protein
MVTLLLAALCQAAPLEPGLDPLTLLAARRIAVDSNVAARVAAEAVIRLADPGAQFFDAEGAAAYAAEQAGQATNPPALRDLGEGVILLHPRMLDDAVADRVASGLVQAAASGGGFILDCRGTGGTNLACVDAIAGHFTEPDVFLYAVQDGAGEDIELHSAPAAPRAAVPVLMLTDGGTTGAADLLAALFAHPRGVLLMGSPTRGEAVRREPVPLSDGRVALLATGRYVRPDGTTWQGRGIVPHIVVSPGSEMRPEIRTNITSRTGRPLTGTAQRHLDLFARLREDVVLARAVELLLGLKALAILPENSHAPVPPVAESR